MNTKISVIIPVYNVEKYLPKCLDSVLNQGFDGVEIIAVNDGSTDSSGEILKTYAEKYNNIIVINQENGGQGDAKNKGIKNASGDYFLFLDSDDSIKKDTLKVCYDTATKTDADIVWFGRESISESGNSLGFKKIHTGEMRLIDKDEMPLLYADDSFITNKLIKKELFLDNNIFYPERAWYEDFRVLAKIFLKAKKIALLEDCFYNYLIRSNSIMHVQNTDRNIEMIYALDDIIDYYKENGEFENHREELSYTASLHIMVFATLRVASIDTHHPLLKKFYDYTEEKFPDFKENPLIKANFTTPHKVIFELSKRKMYKSLYLLNKMNNLR